RGVIQGYLYSMAVDHLSRFNVWAEQPDSGSGLSRLDHPIEAEGHILGREGPAIPPLDGLLEMEDLGQPAIPPPPPFGQVPDDLIGFDRVELHHLVVEGANGRIDGEVASQVGTPHFGVSIIEHRRMTPVHRRHYGRMHPGSSEGKRQ